MMASAAARSAGSDLLVFVDHGRIRIDYRFAEPV